VVVIVVVVVVVVVVVIVVVVVVVDNISESFQNFFTLYVLSLKMNFFTKHIYRPSI
jgi:predicted PurR-regulated permease PerM